MKKKMFYMLQDSQTRGDCLKIDKQLAKTNLKQNNFTSRAINAWNLLPDYVVTSPSMNSFKNKLDSIWYFHPWNLCTHNIKPRYEETTITEELIWE